MRQLFLQELSFQKVYHFTDTSPPIPQDYGPDQNSRPTYTTLRRFLNRRFETPFLGDGDNLWFFFAGHGIRHEQTDYLMPADGDRTDLKNSAIPIHFIADRLRNSGADNVILLIDACRSYEGRRDGVGLGLEKQQGVITLFSCSPEESSYEIQELQQGAFTHVLLQSLRLQGEGNCATVERLYQRLRYYVPQLTRQYRHDAQTPYSVIEPTSKNHLILLPREATLSDVRDLKNDALTAEVERKFKMAEQLWIRVLMVSPGDPQAIAGIKRLSQKDPPAPPATRLSQPARPDAQVILGNFSNLLTTPAHLVPIQTEDEPIIGKYSRGINYFWPAVIVTASLTLLITFLLNSQRIHNFREYAQLTRSLKAKDWKAADQETFDLLLGLVGKKSKQKGLFLNEEWDSFLSKESGCQQIERINALWSDASGGKLGFSAQKRLLDKTKNLDPDRRSKAFYDQVEWTNENSALVEWDYDESANAARYFEGKEPDFIDPVEGHLPAIMMWEKSESERRDKRTLIFLECNL